MRTTRKVLRERDGAGPLRLSRPRCVRRLGGLGAPDGEITLLTPIFEGSTGKAVLEGELIPQFEKENPGVTVNVDYTDYGSLNEKLTTSMASGLVPDVMMMGVGWIEGFAEKGVLADLGEYDLSESGLSETMNEQVLKAGEWDGKLYAVPTMLDTRYGIARKDLLAEAGFDSPPSDWDELREYAKALTKRDAKGKLTQAGLDVMTLDPRQMFEVFLFSNGGTLFNEDATEPAFNSPEGVEALQYVVDLVRKDKVEDIGYSSADADTYPVINGRAAMMVGHNDYWIKAQESNPEVADQLVPFMIHGTEDAMFQGGTLVTVANSSNNKDAAVALLEFLTDAEASLAANEQRGNVPALGELLDSDYVTSNTAVQFAMENLDSRPPRGWRAGLARDPWRLRGRHPGGAPGSEDAQEALDGLAASAQEAMNR